VPRIVCLNHTQPLFLTSFQSCQPHNTTQLAVNVGLELRDGEGRRAASEGLRPDLVNWEPSVSRLPLVITDTTRLTN
jgi:hypothetical protein